MVDILTKKVYAECKCNDLDHVVRFSLWDWEDGDPPELIVEYRLTQHQGFWGRLKSAIAYLFGHDGEALSYHDMLMDDDSVDKLSQLCRDYKLAKEIYEINQKEK